MTGKINRSGDGSPETDRFPVMSRPMCYSFYNTNYHSRYAIGKSDSHHLSVRGSKFTDVSFTWHLRLQ